MSPFVRVAFALQRALSRLRSGVLERYGHVAKKSGDSRHRVSRMFWPDVPRRRHMHAVHLIDARPASDDGSMTEPGTTGGSRAFLLPADRSNLGGRRRCIKSSAL